MRGRPIDDLRRAACQPEAFVPERDIELAQVGDYQRRREGRLANRNGKSLTPLELPEMVRARRVDPELGDVLVCGKRDRVPIASHDDPSWVHQEPSARQRIGGGNRTGGSHAAVNRGTTIPFGQGRAGPTG